MIIDFNSIEEFSNLCVAFLGFNLCKTDIDPKKLSFGICNKETLETRIADGEAKDMPESILEPARGMLQSLNEDPSYQYGIVAMHEDHSRSILAGILKAPDDLQELGPFFVKLGQIAETIKERLNALDQGELN